MKYLKPLKNSMSVFWQSFYTFIQFIHFLKIVKNNFNSNPLERFHCLHFPDLYQYLCFCLKSFIIPYFISKIFLNVHQIFIGHVVIRMLMWLEIGSKYYKQESCNYYRAWGYIPTYERRNKIARLGIVNISRSTIQNKWFS